MKTYEVKNQLNSMVIIEDLDIKLKGYGSAVRISSSDYERSKSLKALKNAVKVTCLSSSVWPFSKPVLTNASSETKIFNIEKPKHSLPQEKVKSLDPDNVPTVQSGTDIKDPRVDLLLSQVNILIDSINKYSEISLKKLPEIIEKISQKETPIVNHYHSDGGSSGGFKSTKVEEPLFIPSKIIPEAQDMRVALQQDEQSRPDIEEAANALKKLRKGKAKK